MDSRRYHMSQFKNILHDHQTILSKLLIIIENRTGLRDFSCFALLSLPFNLKSMRFHFSYKLGYFISSVVSINFFGVLLNTASTK